MDEHLRFLRRNSQQILAVGSHLEATAGSGAGRQSMAEAPDASEGEYLV